MRFQGVRPDLRRRAPHRAESTQRRSQGGGILGHHPDQLTLNQDLDSGHRRSGLQVGIDELRPAEGARQHPPVEHPWQ